MQLRKSSVYFGVTNRKDGVDEDLDEVRDDAGNGGNAWWRESMMFGENSTTTRMAWCVATTNVLQVRIHTFEEAVREEFYDGNGDWQSLLRRHEYNCLALKYRLPGGVHVSLLLRASGARCVSEPATSRSSHS